MLLECAQSGPKFVLRPQFQQVMRYNGLIENVMAPAALPLLPLVQRKDEFWMPMDEDSWKMRNMEKTMNKLSAKVYSLKYP